MNSENTNELENRLWTILNIIIKFDMIQSTIGYLNEHKLETNERDNFENKYFYILTILTEAKKHN